MTIRTVLLPALLWAFAAHAVPALATQPLPSALTETSIPRAYPETGTERADPDKPADQRAREQAQADAQEAACATGDASACAALGTAFERGKGRPQNRPVAELLYRRACDATFADACLRLGELLESTREDADRREAAMLYAGACRMGVLAACDNQADALVWGTLGEPDPQAAEALRRSTCDKGGMAACSALAGLLLAPDRSAADQDEGRALIDRLCRKGDAAACRSAAEHWRLLIAPDAGARVADYERLGCAAGDAWLCQSLGKTELASGQGAAERTAALAFYDRACALDTTQCANAAQIRDEPGLTARCDGGDRAACITLGKSLSQVGSPLEDKARALALLGAGCEAGVTAVCHDAADLVYDQSRTTGIIEPARLEYYLDAACTAGQRDACERLADALAGGEYLPADGARAAVLFARQCEDGRSSACDALEQHVLADPASPLILARANFSPELTPDEEAEERRQAQEERERKRAEDRARNCTTTTVVFEGQSYTDTVCLSTARVIGNGFMARRGAAPWQALLWRPAKLGNTLLTPAQRVMCGGAVIREGWILTAAHCLTDGGKSIVKAGHSVRLGLNNPLSDEGLSYPIVQAIIHPDYKRKLLAFDIALVQYDTTRGTRGSAVIAPARIRLDPLALEQRDLAALKRVVTYGWGVTKVGTGHIPDHLRGARLKLRGTDACTKAILFEDFKRDSVICADDTNAAEGGQACDGDSGGPLITYSDADKVPTVIGVVSGGVECGTAGKPSRYIRVAHPRVQQWLRATLPQPRSR